MVKIKKSSLSQNATRKQQWQHRLRRLYGLSSQYHTQLAETHHAALDQITNSAAFSRLITGRDQNLSRYTRSFVHPMYYDDDKQVTDLV